MTEERDKKAKTPKSAKSAKAAKDAKPDPEPEDKRAAPPHVVGKYVRRSRRR